MIRVIEVSLRVWYPTGGPVVPSMVAELWRGDVRGRRIVGTGERWQAARVILAELSHESFADADEPHEVFHAELSRLLREAGEWLSVADGNALDELRSKGVSVDVFINAVIDDNQLEVQLPVEFLVAASHLQLPINVMSDW